MVRASALSLGGLLFETDSGRVIPKTLKMVRAASLFDAQHLKRIKHGQVTIGWQPLCRLDGSNGVLMN